MEGAVQHSHAGRGGCGGVRAHANTPANSREKVSGGDTATQAVAIVACDARDGDYGIRDARCFLHHQHTDAPASRPRELHAIYHGGGGGEQGGATTTFLKGQEGRRMHSANS
jgi:hypothetical protein